MKIIKRPIFTEKTILLIEKYNQYIFNVDYQLTKPEIFLLIEKMFSIRAKSINTSLPSRIKRRRGRMTGFLSIHKRAFITLDKKEKIVFFQKPLNILICIRIFMNLRNFCSINPGSRHRILDSFKEITHKKPEKKMLYANHRVRGRNNQGIITCNHHGGGHKRLYRKVDFKRKKLDWSGSIRSIEYDPNRNARLALVYYLDGEKCYILAPKGLEVGNIVISGFRVPIEVGNSLPLWQVPLGTSVHNVELRPGAGGQLARSAGTSVQLIAREQGFASLRLPSNEIRLIPHSCWATVGQVGHRDARNKKIGKAGRIRWLGWRPTVRGSVINPVDHPHGGGEGRCPIGRSSPVTPWRKPRLNVKTRRAKKYSDIFILRKKKLGVFLYYLL
jgi:large subunit ribosomal protein L2